MLGIIDYGLGNLFSLENALKFIGVDFTRIFTKEEIDGVDKLILPGVGAFPQAVQSLQALDMFDSLQQTDKPLFGICLGMQLLFTSSMEFGQTNGLNRIPGNVVKITGEVKVPHMGWNQLAVCQDSILLDELPSSPFVYFVHSYRAETTSPYLVAYTDYGGQTTALVQSGHIYGAQFHPEKSGEVGLRILHNFVQKG